MLSQGAKANFSGKELENDVESVLSALDIPYQTQVRFTDCYGNPNSKMDFVVKKLGKISGLAIECKRQNVSGTADQKLPFVVENLRQFPKALLVLDGAHYKGREGIHNYLNSKVSETFAWTWAEDLGDWLIEQANKR